MKHTLLILLLLPLFSGAQTMYTYAGGGTGGLGDGGPATAAIVPNPNYVTFDKAGNQYISDLAGGRIRKVNTSGIITTVAGPGSSSTLGDGGPATSAYLNAPLGVTCDTFGNVYIADRYNYRVRKVNVSTGIMSTVAGAGSTAFGGSGDGGQATAAEFNTVADVIFDKKGNLYIADNSASNIRRVTPSGIISTFAGIGGMAGFSGDGGPATAAKLKDPRYLAFDDVGNLYISEDLGKHIRKVDTLGIMHTIAGTGTGGFNGDSIPATTATLHPQGILFYNNALYVATLEQRIRKIDLSNDTNYIYTIAGTGTAGYNGDGIPAITAKVNSPGGMAMHECFDIYFADVSNARVRKIVLPSVLLVPTIALSGPSVANVGTLVTISATVINAGTSYSINWMNHGTTFATTFVPSVTYTKLAGTDSITAKITSTDPYGCYDTTALARPHIVYASVAVCTLTAQNDYAVYPNPATNMLNVTGRHITSLSISSLVGQVVANREYNASEAQLDITALPAGVYLLKINGTEVRRFVKH